MFQSYVLYVASLLISSFNCFSIIIFYDFFKKRLTFFTGGIFKNHNLNYCFKLLLYIIKCNNALFFENNL
ncbi:hypothetical protein FCS83_01050 [Oenococcus sp. UCMA 17063]|nr:hypothetical protein [Oenococcus sp. UCMA 17063]